MPDLSALQRNAVRELLRTSPVAVELGERFAAAGHALHLVVGSRSTPSRSWGSGSSISRR